MKRKLQLAGVLALTLFFLWLFLRNSDFSLVSEIMGKASVPWLIAAVLANVGALLFRSLRWRTILDPDNPPPFYPAFFATVIGFMLSNLLPVRASDVVRPAILSRRTSIKFSYALGTILTERVLDLVAILTLFVTFTLTSARRFADDPSTSGKYALIKTTGVAAGLLLIVLISMVIALYFYSPAVRRLHDRLSRLLPLRARAGWMSFFDSFVGSLNIAHHHTALIRVILYTALIWLLLSSQFWIVVMAVGRPLPFTASFFVTGLAILGLMVPTPGGVGGFHKVCQVALTSFYHFDLNTAVAVAILFHFVGFFPVIGLGLILLVKEGLTWNQLRRIGEKIEE
ncbi:MAG TPA: lysylphosphatidylglycerol synthase transmembrane domain-containing protein [Thermoanaerobaculia bacterium]|nr:lysylphosphatidylglycerol synthase transmembrane domain-containing protein [Thermoanaerobaculia bacterium]